MTVRLDIMEKSGKIEEVLTNVELPLSQKDIFENKQTITSYHFIPHILTRFELSTTKKAEKLNIKTINV